jgi:queuine tRNA-ribosyltransferase
MPAFMPVGTAGTVKGLTPLMVLQTGSQMILGNTYHLSLRPGSEVVGELGGLHRFMGWDRPILTDSGGFQIFSLAEMAQISERSAVFRSHVDGQTIELSPERAVRIQEELGSDIAMVLDHVVPLPATQAAVAEACERTVRWARRCRDAATRADQVQFGIIQGGLDPALRRACAQQLRELDFFGYAIGGLSVGEEPRAMYETIAATTPHMPGGKPRYLMGVGRPEDLLAGIERGVDMFDCVMPTRNGRNGLAFTDQGPLRLRNHCHRLDSRPLDAGPSTPYSHFSRGYLRHLFLAGEMLGPILLSFHNIAYYQRLMAEARAAIEADSFLEFAEAKLRGWRGG